MLPTSAGVEPATASRVTNRYLFHILLLLIIITRGMVLWPARRLMMLYISMKFHENILNGFQVRADTKLPVSNFKGNNSKYVSK